MGRGTALAIGGVTAIVIGLGAALALRQSGFGRPEAPSGPPPPPLQAADGEIERVDIDGPTVIVVSEVKDSPDLAGNIDRAALTAHAVAQALRRGVSDDLKGVSTVRLAFRAQAVDRFGHDVMAPLMTVDLALADLRGPRGADAPGRKVLALARTVKLGAPGAYDAIAAWCADPARADPAFCAKANPQ
jgi:hypothetical protein